jgi:hypothetical protein
VLKATADARFTTVLIAAMATLIAGCANDGKDNRDPGAKPLPHGESCSSIRAELNRMDARGVPSKVEAVNAGRRVSDKDRALAERYNTLLNQYLGARCHV